MVLLMCHKTLDGAHNIAQVHFIFNFTFNIINFSSPDQPSRFQEINLESNGLTLYTCKNHTRYACSCKTVVKTHTSKNSQTQRKFLKDFNDKRIVPSELISG